MKSTGIARKVDELGRIVLPIELRRALGIAEKDLVEIFVEGNTIVLKKQEGDCVFCGSSDNTAQYKDKYICSLCARDIRAI
jgi:transcriptional pleiotropic regulator of transition state genes